MAKTATIEYTFQFKDETTMKKKFGPFATDATIASSTQIKNYVGTLNKGFKDNTQAYRPIKQNILSDNYDGTNAESTFLTGIIGAKITITEETEINLND